MNLLFYTVSATTIPREPAKCSLREEYVCRALFENKSVHHTLINSQHCCHCIIQSPGRTDPESHFNAAAIPKRVQPNQTSPIQIP